MTPPATPTFEIHLTPADLRRSMEVDVADGLVATPRELPPVYFYDDRGSRLFDEITRLPEYYPTRAERSILEIHAKDITALADAEDLVELGAGTCDKSRLLLDAMAATGRLRRFVPLDVSETTLREAAEALVDEYPGLEVHGVVADFHRHLDRLPSDGPRLFAFLGGTVGNLDPGQRRCFFDGLAATMGPADRLLLGVDLIKDRERLVAAYDDAAGTTAAFNRNVLHVLNRELGADFSPDRFDHVATWNEPDHRIEMWLRSTCRQTVTVADLDLEVTFADGEAMRTELSTKFDREGLEAELAASGFAVDGAWTSADDEFLLVVARPA